MYSTQASYVCTPSPGCCGVALNASSTTLQAEITASSGLGERTVRTVSHEGREECTRDTSGPSRRLPRGPSPEPHHTGEYAMSALGVSRKGSVARDSGGHRGRRRDQHCAAKDRGSLPTATASAPQLRSVMEPSGRRASDGRRHQVLSLRNGKDATFNLGYFRGCGWRYLPVRRATDQHFSKPG